MCLATLFALTTWAADFTEGGIYYNFLEDGSSVAVTWGGSSATASDGTPEYTGNFIVPETVEHEGVEYAITTIGDHAFYSCAITGLTMFNNITSIEDDAFHYCRNLTTITIPSSVTSIGSNAFNACSGLTSITFPESVTQIEEGTCNSCTSLEEVIIGSNVTYISENAFANNTSLKRFYSLSSTPPECYYLDVGGMGIVFQTSFYNTNIGECTLYVPIGSIDTYKETQVWKDFGTFSEFTEIDIVVADSENDGYATFYHGTYDLTLPDGVKAYYASEVKDGVVTLTEVEGSTIPAGNAVLVEGSIADYYMDATEATTTTTLSGNMLYGSDTDTETTVNNVTDGYYFYKLSTVNGENLGFYWGAEDGGTFSIAAHKAWLAVPTTEGTRALSFKKGESDTTGITSVEVENEANAVSGIYTLQGVRVSDMSQKGVYIVNGRKVLVK